MKTIRYFGVLQEQLLCARGSQEGAQRCRRDPSRHSPALCCPQAGPLGSTQHRETRDAPEEAKNGPKGQDQKSAAGDHQCFYTRASCGPCILDWPPSAQHAQGTLATTSLSAGMDAAPCSWPLQASQWWCGDFQAKY